MNFLLQEAGKNRNCHAPLSVMEAAPCRLACGAACDNEKEESAKRNLLKEQTEPFRAFYHMHDGQVASLQSSWLKSLQGNDC